MRPLIGEKALPRQAMQSAKAGGTRDSEMVVQRGCSDDLAVVLGWLQQEHTEEDGEGFWCNRETIERALIKGDFWVIRLDGQAVAFQVGEYSADIVSVRKEFRRQGLGDALFAASYNRAIASNVNVLWIECSPRTSWPFWQRHGFERYGDLSDFGRITARRVLPRLFQIPSDLPIIDVVISFCPHAALIQRDVPPISVHHVRGGRLASGAIILGRRVIGLCQDEPEKEDIAIKIEVEGKQHFFDKAKYDDAKEVGVIYDWRGDAFFIDVVL